MGFAIPMGHHGEYCTSYGLTLVRVHRPEQISTSKAMDYPVDPNKYPCWNQNETKAGRGETGSDMSALGDDNKSVKSVKREERREDIRDNDTISLPHGPVRWYAVFFPNPESYDD